MFDVKNRILQKIFLYKNVKKAMLLEKNVFDQDIRDLDKQFKILAFADLHYWGKDELQKVLDYEFDVCVLLGDIPRDAIAEIVELVKGKLIVGVPGNHDTWEMFDGFPVMNLHRKMEEFNGVRFAGFGGSVRYKKGPYAMHTQEECRELIADLPKAAILLSHDCSYGLFGREGSHAGLRGITEYVEKHKVKLNLCGHHHQACVKKEKGCTTVCVYRCAVVTYPEITVEQVF